MIPGRNKMDFLKTRHCQKSVIMSACGRRSYIKGCSPSGIFKDFLKNDFIYTPFFPSSQAQGRFKALKVITSPLNLIQKQTGNHCSFLETGCIRVD